MKMKSIICGAMSLSSMMLMASDTPEVSDVVMSQASFGRMVTVTYKLSNAANGAVVTFDVETNCTVNGETKWASIGGEAVCNAQGAVWRKVTSSDADSEGKYTITWRPDLSWEGHKVTLAEGGARAVVTAWALDNTPDYMVVDISAAAKPNTQRYYTSTNFLPGGLFGNPDYRTTSLVMRKILAKDVEWTMGSTAQEAQRNAKSETTHKVKLDSNYYIGVFEITQAQWGEIQTVNKTPSYFQKPGDCAMRPVERVSYNEIRNGADDSYDWPNSPNPVSFLGILRSRTGIMFDLPSEAQWEFAARAGNGSSKWGDGSEVLNLNKDSNLARIARCRLNSDNPEYVGTPPDTTIDASRGTALVGSYPSNDWGLYDMFGNVNEWCLDYYQDDIAMAKDTAGVLYGGRVNINPLDSGKCLSDESPQTNARGVPYRVVRGGAYNEHAPYCRSANRAFQQQTLCWVIGFRVVCGMEAY
jgi:formylglycine-generating enzyme required for sulfatase activity